MFRLLTALCVLTLLSGCAATVVDRDFAKEERDFIKQHGEKAAKDPFYAPETPPHVVGANYKHVIVLLNRERDIKRDGMDLQKWSATLHNNNDYPVCVITLWKLMDFNLSSDYPDFILSQELYMPFE